MGKQRILKQIHACLGSADVRIKGDSDIVDIEAEGESLILDDVPGQHSLAEPAVEVNRQRIFALKEDAVVTGHQLIKHFPGNPHGLFDLTGAVLAFAFQFDDAVVGTVDSDADLFVKPQPVCFFDTASVSQGVKIQRLRSPLAVF